MIEEMVTAVLSMCFGFGLLCGAMLRFTGIAFREKHIELFVWYVFITLFFLALSSPWSLFMYKAIYPDLLSNIVFLEFVIGWLIGFAISYFFRDLTAQISSKIGFNYADLQMTLKKAEVKFLKQKKAVVRCKIQSIEENKVEIKTPRRDKTIAMSDLKVIDLAFSDDYDMDNQNKEIRLKEKLCEEEKLKKQEEKRIKEEEKLLREKREIEGPDAVLTDDDTSEIGSLKNAYEGPLLNRSQRKASLVYRSLCSYGIQDKKPESEEIFEGKDSNLSKSDKRTLKEHRTQRRILAWLSHDTFSSNQMLSNHLGIEVKTVKRMMGKLRDKGFVVGANVYDGNRNAGFWGITNEGVSEHLGIAESPTSIYTVGKYSNKYHLHKLGVQPIRDFIEKKFPITEWRSAKDLPFFGQFDNPEKWSIYPDAIINMNHPFAGELSFAIEYEQSRKTDPSYISIFKEHIKAIEQGHYDAVQYVCRTDKEAACLSCIFGDIIDKHGRTSKTQYPANELFIFQSLESLQPIPLK